MASIVSGLGKLFHPVSTPLAPHSGRAQRQLESVTEEAHTYDLLFPEVENLQKTQHHAFPLKHGDPSSIAAAASSSDERGGFNIHHPRDIRFIVGQYIGGQPRVLFDTQPSPLTADDGNTADGDRNALHDNGLRQANVQRSRTAPHTRQSSLSHTAQSALNPSGLPLSPVNEVAGLIGREPRRPNTSDGETVYAQLAREERQETDAMLSSMFGATGHRISAGMKVHVKPYAPPQSESLRPISPSQSRLGSQRRRTPLTRSTTFEDLHNFPSGQSRSSTAQQASRRQSSSILVTKIFYVDSADEASRLAMERHPNELESDEPMSRDGAGENHRLSTVSDHNDQTSKKYRTPAFAIAMLIYVPLQLQTNKTSSSVRGSPALGHNFLTTLPENTYQSAEAFDRSVDYIMAHWNTIMRALSSLEIIVRCEISDALSQLDIHDSIQGLITSPPVPNIKPGRIRAPPLPALQLPQGALQRSTVIRKAVDLTGRRIVSALQIRGVVVGQGRWGVWREEARGVGQWAGGREQNFFLFNLLTAFLGNHTEWLDVMSSRLSRGKRSRSRGPIQYPQHDVIRHRTVIVSSNKMAARRLVFLLSAFLPPSRLTPKRQDEPRSGFSVSIPTSSSSPLTSSYLSHQMSLKRNERKSPFEIARRDNIDNSIGAPDLDATTEVSDDLTITESPIIPRKNSILQHSRDYSDVGSINSVAMPIAAVGPRFRKGGTTTTATILPQCAIPVAHFSGISPDPGMSAPADQRPGSSSSIASLALHRTLSRADSIDQSGTSADSQSTGHWFWHSRRGSSTGTSETPISSAEGLGILVPKDLRGTRHKDKLSCMADDASVAVAGHKTPRAQAYASQGGADPLGQISHPKDIPRDRDEIEPFPLNLSVNESDGVIDVNLPLLESQASSFGSLTSSPRALRSATLGLRESLRPPSPSLSMSSTVSVNRHHTAISEVSGWLTRFHQDLALQAVQPYDTLKEEIKHAMRTEAVPTTTTNPPHDGQEKVEDWTDVGVSLVADTTTFTLTRITLRRKNASLRHHHADALFGLDVKDNPDEEFIEESLIEHDATLTEAVEKILSHSGQSSHIASQGVSRVPSRLSSPTRFTTHAGDKTPPFEIPKSECKKMVLGALEQVAKSVRNEIAGNVDSTRPDDDEVKDPLREGVRRWFEEVGLTVR